MSRSAFALRVALAGEWSLIVLIGVSPIVLALRLPADLQAYLDQGFRAGYTSFGRIWLVVSIVCITLSVASSLALWFFRRWARFPYTAGRVGAILVAFSGGPVVEHSLAFTLEGLWMFLSGAIVALLFFAPIDKFATPKA
jgi:hypothetical protein